MSEVLGVLIGAALAILLAVEKCETERQPTPDAGSITLSVDCLDDPAGGVVLVAESRGPGGDVNHLRAHRRTCSGVVQVTADGWLEVVEE